jgi:hypothetical protein
VAASDEAKDIIKRFLSAANVRLGRNGSAEVKEHPFFRNNKWTFDNICQGALCTHILPQKTLLAIPPFVPTLSTDDDTSNFEDVDPPEQGPVDNFQMQQAFSGSQLAFIGFTYSNEFK